MRRERVVLSVLFLLFLVSRLVALQTLPIFFDETIHLRWAFNVYQGDKVFRPWADGRLLTIWLYSVILPRVRDILSVARALSAVAGATSLLCLVAIGRRLVSFECGLVAALLYVLCPFCLFYDRLALTDSFLAGFAALSLLLTLRLLEAPTLWGSVLLGTALTLAVLTKFSGILLALIPAACAVILGVRGARRALFVAYLVAGGFLAYPLFVFLRSGMMKIAVDQARGEAFFGDVLGGWLLAWTYLTYFWGFGLILLALLGLAFGRRARVGVLLVALILAPVAVMIVSLRVWFARYILWVTIPFLILAAMGALALFEIAPSRLKPWLFLLLGVGVGFPLLVRDRLLIFDPPRAGLPPGEAMQYVNGWPSGYGVRETVEFFGGELAKHPGGITVVTHARAHRATWNALDLYFQDEPRVHLEDLDFSDPESVPWLKEGGWSNRGPVYVVLSPRFEGAYKSTPSQEALARLAQKVASFSKPDGTLANEIFLIEGG